MKQEKPDIRNSELVPCSVCQKTPCFYMNYARDMFYCSEECGQRDNRDRPHDGVYEEI